MRSYVISYDLRAPGRNYQGLQQALRNQFSGACPLVQSTWLVHSRHDARTVHATLWQHMDANDALCVFEWSGTAVWDGLSADVTAWLQTRPAA